MNEYKWLLWLPGVSKNDLLFAIKAEVLARLPLTT